MVRVKLKVKIVSRMVMKVMVRMVVRMKAQTPSKFNKRKKSYHTLPVSGN